MHIASLALTSHLLSFSYASVARMCFSSGAGQVAACMSSFVITVEFKLNLGAMDRFQVLMDSNAKGTCQHESGCRRFDELVPEGEADRIFLYEIYDDGAAFDADLKTGHLQVFSRESAPLAVSKNVAFLSPVCEASAQGPMP